MISPVIDNCLRHLLDGRRPGSKHIEAHKKYVRFKYLHITVKRPIICLRQNPSSKFLRGRAGGCRCLVHYHLREDDFRLQSEGRYSAR